MEKDEKGISDHQQQLLDLLAGVSGHLEVTSPQDERSIHSLQETLARVLPSEDITTVKNRFFSVESSDLFFTDAIASRQWTQLKDVAGRAVKEPRMAELRVFVRDVPVRSTQIPGSVPSGQGVRRLRKRSGPSSTKMVERSGSTFSELKSWSHSISMDHRSLRFSLMSRCGGD